jgi:tetratricopeptide (TPR) repeat protein
MIKKSWILRTGCLLALGCLLSCTTKNLADQKPIAEAARNLGEAYLREGKYPAALNEFLKAESLYPNDYYLQNDLGLTYYYMGKQDLAVRHFKKALELNNDYAPARNNLGNAYAEQNEWDKAIEQYKLVASDLLYATPHYPYSNLGVAYFQKKKYEQSVYYFMKALKVKSDFVNALFGLAQTYMAMEKVSDAIAKLEKAADVSPQSALVHFDLAKAYRLNRDYHKAHAAYLTVVQLAPDSPLADKALEFADNIDNLDHRDWSN